MNAFSMQFAVQAALNGRAKPFGAPEAKISPPGEQMLQISASAQTVLLSKVAVGWVRDAEPRRMRQP